MRTVIVKNISSEGPGTITDFLDKAGMPFDVLEPENVPGLKTLDGYSALVVLGGPMAVYDSAGHPQVEASLRLIKEALTLDIKILGVCLGAQLIAHALGARVYNGNGNETGWMQIELTAEGLNDPVLATLIEPGGPDGPGGPGVTKADVFQLHGDTFDIPEGAVRLAGSKSFKNQAFRVGKNAYALQFHVEMTRDKVQEWAKDEPTLLTTALSDTEYWAYLKKADKLYSKFFGIA
jgi:GMP synthase-like glutamine amidotransferase